MSPGCKHCYAETLAERFRGVAGHPFEDGFDLRLVPEALDLPLRWRAGRRIFVNSMSDLFHDDIPTNYILRVFDTMRQAQQHQFQVLTKRSRRLLSICAGLELPKNVWLGVSIETEEYIQRAADLRRVTAPVRFLSIEPLLGPLDNLDLSGIHWVIVGGESGHHARPMNPSWVRSIRDQCKRARVPFFFKQWGGQRKDLTGRTLDGRTWNEMPLAFASRATDP